MSGATRWRGYWQQRGRRAEMRDLLLRFANGTLTGGGVDCVGRFTFDGTYDPTGAVVMVKQYLGMHKVLYKGQFDGEGTIFGRWSIWSFDSGEFMLTLARDGAACEEREIEEIVPDAPVKRLVGV
ncbi:MAG TPA: hypothetical protein VG826_02485 [Pirellulales bacterium]|nr:hypothetical protein [Pirellulales bacterium]